ncbi:cobalt ECF transporter T component CbiQ [Thermodesulfatator autotrophicus]|uniref:Cobalt ABC transporter permease n=1 Tax=Thermodesulfatator autotrophicus TaxID=1795632 RepID=A0A177E9X7_9BACT|nr:cobalt ECF transporter T component CbiQ [Thermodesulfatator autotrophicus]OAG28725.1 hypothetical protein TH606_00225 [Thermodesulfatator autotrophicus]
MKKENSFLKSCDPRVKFVLALLYAIIVAITYNFSLLVLASIFSLICLLLSGLSFFYYLKRLGLVNLFLVFVLITLPFTTPGEEVFKIKFLSASKEGVSLAFLIFFKSNLIILTTTALLSTSSIFELAHALHHLFLPSKLVQLLFFTFRYLHVIEKEFWRLKDAAVVRCFVPRTNLFTYRTMAYLVGSLIVRSYDRSQRVYEAMLCRSFNGTFPVYHHFHLRKKDILFGIFGVTYLVAILILC